MEGAKASPVPSKELDLTKKDPLSETDASAYRSAVGSGIYLSADRRDIHFAVKELARHMSEPRQCDMTNLKILIRYLIGTPAIVRVVTLDTDEGTSGSLPLHTFTDSDWAGCKETRRSTDCVVTTIGGAVIQCSTQTQPGLPASSSSDAELRGMARGTREVLFVKQLAEQDFHLKCGLPRLHADSAVALQTARKIGPGNKLRHLEVCHFYTQGAYEAKLIALAKVPGKMNPANVLTKHPSSGIAVQQSLASLGMVNAAEGTLQLDIDQSRKLVVNNIQEQVSHIISLETNASKKTKYYPNRFDRQLHQSSSSQRNGATDWNSHKTDGTVLDDNIEKHVQDVSQRDCAYWKCFLC